MKTLDFNKKIIISKHAMERFEERKYKMTDKQKREYKSNPRKFLTTMLRPMNIKHIRREGKELHVITKVNYDFIIQEKENCNMVKTIITTRTRHRKSLGARLV